LANEKWILTDDDLYLFNEGSHLRLYEKLGAHPAVVDGREGTHFAVWAPNARNVSVMGDFNGWSADAHPLGTPGNSGIWEGFVPGVRSGHRYKYRLVSQVGGYTVDKADPFALHGELSPQTASTDWTLDYEWGDKDWMSARHERAGLDAPMAIYEVHLGSWRRAGDRGERFLGCREIAAPLVDYVHSMGFTHVEFLPLMEHPFYGSWGYQTTGYFAPSSRYGTPQDFMYLIDCLHQAGIGVILDWVPSHFPNDEHGLGFFDGTHLFEHGDPRQGIHPDWDSFIFNYGRHEVRSFLLSSAIYWIDKYHVDGLRVDAVASMLYLDYSRREGGWIPNVHGGRENLEAIDFLRRLNAEIYREFPDVHTHAEESTAWPMVSRPTYLGGLGFGMKWDMGWMHDTLKYMALDPIFRDEVAHGKASLLGKMPGDDWQKLANLRALFGYMYTQPGKKLLFMGGEFGQRREWNHDGELEWNLLEHKPHQGLQRWVRDLNTFYRGERALHELDCAGEGFQWIDPNDSEQSTLTYLRRGKSREDVLVVACNLTPVPRHNYRLGVPRGGQWTEILNSDASLYGGSGQGNLGGVRSVPVAYHGHTQSIVVTLPPLGVVVFKPA
jgi:1,4-alpha-glucan branching enzyme